MRVLYFTRDFTPHDYRFLTSLAGSGIETYFLRLERRGRQVEDRSLPAEIRQVMWRGGREPFQWRSLPALLADLNRVLREVQPDVLHAGPIQTTGFLSALSGYQPLLTMSWGSDLLKDADRSRIYNWMTRFTLKRSTALAGDCAAVRSKAQTFGFPPERAFIFPWGIDLDHFSPGGEEESEAAHDFRARRHWEDCFVVLSNRSWEPVYGVDVALKGFARAAQEEPLLRLLLLGGGSLAPQIHRLIQEQGLEDKVFMGGNVPQADLPNIYRSADLYLSASHSDGSSVSLMEALGCGKPVLVSDIPGNREWITPGMEGWLFPDGDDRALAEGMLNAARSLAFSRSNLPEMGKQARQKAVERADWSENFQVLLQAYEFAIRENRVKS